MHVLRDANGKVQAFVNELPSFKTGVATIDLMRRRHNAPTNCIDFLFICLLREKLSEGYDGFSLGMSPLDGKPYITNRASKTIHHVYRISNNFIGFKGLHQFKSKYNPAWEPRYVWYTGSPLRLSQIGLAVLSIMKDS